jgi:putative iron-regulated protein
MQKSSFLGATLIVALSFLVSWAGGFFAAQANSTASLPEQPAAQATAGAVKNDSLEKSQVATAVIAHHATLVHATYAELVASLELLSARVDAFVAKPSAASHKAAKDAWVASRKVYGLTEAFRFYGGPIDDPKSGPEGLMNAWPLDESYLDSVRGAPASGVVGNVKAFPDITKDVLLSLHEKDGEKNISTGYHAIEFLLWGQDFNAKGPGQRSHLDYVDNGKNNATRRARVLTLLSDMLLAHARGLEKAWAPGVAGNFASTFALLPVADSVQKILSGLATLSVDEMAGERMIVALSKNDPENEQSCFSDTTTNDFVSNAQGLANVWSGECKTGCGKNFQAGPGLRALVAHREPRLAKKIDDALASSFRLLASIPAPFDSVIASPATSKGRKKAEAAVASLEAQSKLFARAAKVLGVEINVQE